MHTEVAWVLVSSRAQVQPQIIPEPGYLPDYLSVSYDCVTRYSRGQSIWETLYFPCEIAHCGKSSISIFKESFASIDKTLFLGGGLGTRL